MSKWFGKIGFSDTSETSPGIWEELIVEKSYYGDLEQDNRRRSQNSDTINDELTLSNRLSILADPFINQNCHHIKYVEINGVKWKVSDIQVAFPRLQLSFGGVYNGE